MQFKVSELCFQKSTLVALYTSKNSSIILKTYNQSDIKQLGVCTVILRHKIKDAKCRFLVVPGDSPALLGRPDIELPTILIITCEVIDDTDECRKIDSQTIEASIIPSCTTKPHRPRQIKWMLMILMQAWQIISDPVSTEQQTKEQVRFWQTKYILNSVGVFFRNRLLWRNIYSTGNGWQLAIPHSPSRVVYAFLEPLIENLERLPKHQVIVPLGMYETSEGCNSYVQVGPA